MTLLLSQEVGWRLGGNGDDWVTMKVEDDRCEAYGDPHRLGEMIATFRAWIEPGGKLNK